MEAEQGPLWEDFRQQVLALRRVVDPDWSASQVDEELKESNNNIYMIFDLVYLAHRELFEAILDNWLRLATLPWQAKSNISSPSWLQTIQGLANFGLAQGPDNTLAVLPFYPLRLPWDRQLFAQIESWLQQALMTGRPLEFEAGVMSEQLQVADRPHVLFQPKQQRLVEAYTGPFFSLFVPEARQQRARAPLSRARQKLEQFKQMWPFSQTRLHLAFQPGDVGEEIYRLVAGQAETDRDGAFRVRAVVDGPGVTTEFDRYLLMTGDETTDLLTQEHLDTIFPRVDYAKGRLEGEDRPVVAHAALLVDAFREEEYDFTPVVGRLNPVSHWQPFTQLASEMKLDLLKQANLASSPYHIGEIAENLRDLVYVPMHGDQPEYLFLLYNF